MYLRLVKIIGGLYDIGPLSIGIFDKSVMLCWHRVIKWQRVFG